MNKNSTSINIIKDKLDKISGLDGQIGEITESLIPIINAIVIGEYIKVKEIKEFRIQCEKYNDINTNELMNKEIDL